MHPIGRHTIGRGHGPQRDTIFVSSLVAHDADTPHRQKNRPSLPNLVIQTCTTQRIDINLVHLLQNVDLSGVISPKSG